MDHLLSSSSVAGVSLYERIGFRPFGEIAEYRPEECPGDMGTPGST
jgi:hypothetical protein